MKYVLHMTQTQQLIQQQFAHLHPQNEYELAPLTYFKIGGPAEVFVDATTRDDIVSVIQFCHQHDIKLTILSGLSNVLNASEGLRGLVMRTA